VGAGTEQTEKTNSDNGAGYGDFPENYFLDFFAGFYIVF
jgi:hypothetical protein